MMMEKKMKIVILMEQRSIYVPVLQKVAQI